MGDDTTTFLEGLVEALDARICNEFDNQQTPYDKGYVAALIEARALAIIARDEELS